MRGLDVLELLPSEFLSENEIAAAVLADQGRAFNPQQQFRVTWPAEPVVARAYLDQLERGDPLSDSPASDLAEALERAETRLQEGAPDANLAGRLESLALALADYQGGELGKQRRAALAETLNGIATRLR